MNVNPVSPARLCTLRSWLSRWSYDDAYGHAVKAGPDNAETTLLIGNRADHACTPTRTRRLFEAIGHPDVELHEIRGADQRDKPRGAVGIVTDWLACNDFAAVL